MGTNTEVVVDVLNAYWEDGEWVIAPSLDDWAGELTDEQWSALRRGVQVYD